MTSDGNGHHLRTAGGEPGIGDGESYGGSCCHVDGKWQPTLELVDAALNDISTNNAAALAGIKARIKEVGASPKLVTQVCAEILRRIVSEKYSAVECDLFATFAREIGADGHEIGNMISFHTTTSTSPRTNRLAGALRRLGGYLYKQGTNNRGMVLALHIHKTRSVAQQATV